MNYLKSNPDFLLLDIGANIGKYKFYRVGVKTNSYPC